MDIHSLTLTKLKSLISHPHIELLTRGNSAIWSALHLAKKGILIPQEGGWLTYRQYPQKLKIPFYEVKTHCSIIDLSDLRQKLSYADFLIYQNPGGYFAEQPMKEIYRLCHRNHCLVILDVSGSLGTRLCDGRYADVLVCSFGKDKLVNAGFGGFISCKNKRLFERIKLTFKILSEEEKFKAILEKLNNLPNRINFLLEKRKKIIKDLKNFNIIYKNHLGFVLIVKYKNSLEKEKIINYCQNHWLEYTECPRYIRINQRAISIEIKRLKQ